MPLFGKSKRAQEVKKQEVPAEPKPAPYRHVPKHAASDARTNGLAEADRAAQQKRIMAASQSRLNSMNSNYSVKSNFTNEVPINGNQSKPFFFSSSNSPRPSSGNAKGKDRSAVQPGSPAGTTQPHVKAQEDYTKLRNPSLLSNITAPRTSSPLAVRNQTISAADQTSDSGYGSVGQVSRPDSKAPSTISKAPTEPRQSSDVKTVPQIPTGLDFLPKLDFEAPESSRPPTSEQPPSPIHVKKPSTITSTRDRAISGASSYVSKLDPGADRRSIISTSSRPFDQIDFSKPGQQFVPVSPTSPTTPKTRSPVVKARSVTPITKGDALKQPVQEPWKYRSVPQSPQAEQNLNTETPTQQKREDKVASEPARSPEFVPEPEPVKPREPAQYTAPKAAPQEQPIEPSTRDAPSLGPKPEWMTNEQSRNPPTPVQQEEDPIQPPTMQPEPSQPKTSDPDDDNERGGRTPVQAATPFPPAEPASRDASSTRTMQSEQPKQQATRHRNWSRPSQSSGSQYGRKESVGGASDRSVQMPRPSIEQQSGLGAPERQTETRDLIPAEPIHSNTRNAQVEQAPQAYVPQSQQGSSVYGDSAYNPSTRGHSPSRRHSFAPSELLDYGHSNGRAALPPLSILDGLKVNKRGKILDEEGDAIGELVEGDIIDCVRQRANAFGHVLDDYGRVVGRVSTVARGDGTPTHSSATTMRSRGMENFRPDPMQRYALPESQIVSPVAPTLAKPFEYTQEEDPRQRAAKLQALAARRGGPEPQVELDGSGAAEQTPLVDHSEIFAPPFIPSRSPKRSPAEPEHRQMDNYFAKPPEKRQSPPQEAPRLKKWASRNLEPEREEMQASKQPSAPSTITQASSEHTVSRPSTAEAPPSQSQRSSGVLPGQQDTAAQNFISSDQPKDIFPWMTGSAQQEPAKWKDANAFTYKGEAPSEEGTGRKSTSTARGTAAPSQNQSAFATNGAAPKQYATHLAASAGSRKSNRTSYRDHQPIAKSPLSTHSE